MSDIKIISNSNNETYGYNMDQLCDDLSFRLEKVDKLIYFKENAAHTYYDRIKTYFDDKKYTVVLLNASKIEISKNPAPVKNAEFMRANANNYWLQCANQQLIEIIKDIEIESNKGLYGMYYIIGDKDQSNYTEYKIICSQCINHIMDDLKNLNFKPSIKGKHLHISWAD